MMSALLYSLSPRRTSAVLAMILIFAATGTLRAQGFSTSVDGNDIARSLERALAGTSLHLHNLGSLNGATYHAAGASSVKWPVSQGPGLRTRFTIPDASRDILGRRYGYYLNHVRSTGLSVTSQSDALLLTIPVASEGPALLGRCVRLRPPATACTSLGEARMPAVEWLGARIDIRLRPVAFERSLAFDVIDIKLGGTFDIGNACDFPVVGARLCTTLNRYIANVRQRVEAEVRASLDAPDIKRQVASAVRVALDQTYEIPTFGVRNAQMSDGKLTLTLALGR